MLFKDDHTFRSAFDEVFHDDRLAVGGGGGVFASQVVLLNPYGPISLRLHRGAEGGRYLMPRLVIGL